MPAGGEDVSGDREEVGSRGQREGWCLMKGETIRIEFIDDASGDVISSRDYPAAECPRLPAQGDTVVMEDDDGEYTVASRDFGFPAKGKKGFTLVMLRLRPAGDGTADYPRLAKRVA